MSFQGPAMQSLVSAYMEQSRNVFQQMQEQLQDRTRNFFPAFPSPDFRECRDSVRNRPARSRRRADNETPGEGRSLKFFVPWCKVNLKHGRCTQGRVRLARLSKALVDSEGILTRLRAEGYAISPSTTARISWSSNTCGFIESAIQESLDAIGEALEENGRVIRHRMLGAKGGRRAADTPESSCRLPPTRARGGHDGGARASAEASRSLHRPGASPRHQAHSARTTPT